MVGLAYTRGNCQRLYISSLRINRNQWMLGDERERLIRIPSLFLYGRSANLGLRKGAEVNTGVLIVKKQEKVSILEIVSILCGKSIDHINIKFC